MSKKPYVVGIAGGTASGKTTLVGRLKEDLAPLKVHVFGTDSYFRFPNLTTIAPFTGVEYREMNHPDSILIDELAENFAKACAGEPFQARTLNFREGKASYTTIDEEFDVILIEGLFVLYFPQIRDLLDFKIFVDLESDERLIRRIKRWLPLGQTMDEISDRFLDSVRYRHQEFVEPTRWYADVVINGWLREGSMDVVETYIRSGVEKKK